MNNDYLQDLPEYKILKQKKSLLEKERHKWLVEKVGHKMARRLEEIDRMARQQVENDIIYGRAEMSIDYDLVVINEWREEMSIDYDLFVINAQNKNTTPEQLRDCIYDALKRMDERLNNIESLLKENSDELS